jgi:hypothetical protein
MKKGYVSRAILYVKIRAGKAYIVPGAVFNALLAMILT